jgi:hypothetical protein
MKYIFKKLSHEGNVYDNTVIDITALPTENIDDSKIYRTTEKCEPVVYLAGTGIDGKDIAPFNEIISYIYTMILGTPIDVSCPVYVVESLPDTMEPMVENMTDLVFIMPCYIIESTGIAYISPDGTSSNAATVANMLDNCQDGGWVDSVEDIVESDTSTVYSVRGDEKTVYGIPATESQKVIYKYTTENGWDKFPRVREIEITANGEYDATVGIAGGVGDLEPGAQYVYKYDITREDIVTLYGFANADGLLHKWTLMGDGTSNDITTSIFKIDNEYILITNNYIGTAYQFYCTAEVVYNGKLHPAGWGIVGMLGDSTPPIVVDSSFPIVLRMPDVMDDTTIFGAEGMLDFYKTNLLCKKINPEVHYSIDQSADYGDIVGKIGGKDVVKTNFTLTLDQVKEPAVLYVNYGDVEEMNYIYTAMFQYLLYTGSISVEYDGIYISEVVGYYIKDLNADMGDITIEGDIEEEVWYIPYDSVDSSTHSIGFCTYYPNEPGIAPCDGYNKIVVNVTTNKKPTLETKTVTKNGIYTAPEGVDGYSSIEVDVQPTLETKTVTENGIYTTPEGVDGYSSIEVDVCPYNIACGTVPPEDTTKLWVKCDSADDIQVIPPSQFDKDFGATNPEKCSIRQLLTTLPITSRYITTATIGTKVYLFGGAATYEYLNTINVFDTETETITTLDTTLPDTACQMASAIVGTKVYLFGGSGGSSGYGYLKTINVFDTETETITTLDTTLPYTAGSMASAIVGTKVYLFGGANEYGRFGIINVFDTETETITTLNTKLPIESYSISSVTIGTKVYLFGGYAKSYLKTINVFDTETETITTLDTTLPTEASEIAAELVGTKVYLFGGFTGSSIDTINVFDPETETITTLSTKLPTATTSISSTVVGTKVYLFGGYNKHKHIDIINVFTQPIDYLAKNNLLIVANYDVKNNVCDVVKGLEMGVDSVYIGNANNKREQVDTSIYKDATWVSIYN